MYRVLLDIYIIRSKIPWNALGTNKMTMYKDDNIKGL